MDIKKKNKEYNTGGRKMWRKTILISLYKKVKQLSAKI